MKVHVLVEGPSERALLDAWLPRFLPNHRAQVHPHQGKGRLSTDPGKPLDPRRRGLLDQLPAKLRAYGKSLDPRTDGVVVLVDADDDDCVDLKRRLVALLGQIDPRPNVLFRIAVEETEAFYLGDMAAVHRAFPGTRASRLKDYKPDACVGTWEVFRDAIGETGEDKVDWAERIGPHLTTDPEKSTSPSFRQLCYGLRWLVGEREGGAGSNPDRRPRKGSVQRSQRGSRSP
jgi:hypothetical protein